MGIVHHTDAEREWAYDRQSQIGTLDKALDEADAARLDGRRHEAGLEDGLSVDLAAGVLQAGFATTLRGGQVTRARPAKISAIASQTQTLCCSPKNSLPQNTPDRQTM